MTMGASARINTIGNNYIFIIIVLVATYILVAQLYIIVHAVLYLFTD